MNLNDARKVIMPVEPISEDSKLINLPRPLFSRTPVLTGDNVEAKREEIRRYFHSTLDRYEQLFEILKDDEAYFKKPISLRHPLIFYLGHTATFFTNKLLLAGLIEERINPRMESMFAVGVDEMSWDDLDTTHYDWPSVDEVYAYRKTIRGIVDRLITETPLTLPIGWDSPWWTIMMGIEHERIHLETSSVLIRQHALEHVSSTPPGSLAGRSGARRPKIKLIDVPEGIVDLGKKKTDPTYGWDNEYGTHVAQVARFSGRQIPGEQSGISRLLFEADGYATESFWEDEGRAWRVTRARRISDLLDQRTAPNGICA